MSDYKQWNLGTIKSCDGGTQFGIVNGSTVSFREAIDGIDVVEFAALESANAEILALKSCKKHFNGATYELNQSSMNGLIEQLEAAKAEIAAWKLKNDTLNWPKVEAEVSSLKSELEAAKVENLKIEEKLRMAFNCCGGNDDEFKEHTLDCIDWVSRAEPQASHTTLSAQLAEKADQLHESVKQDYELTSIIEGIHADRMALSFEKTKLADQVTAAKEALEYINHECMNSDICPTREQMQIKARETLARINNDK